MGPYTSPQPKYVVLDHVVLGAKKKAEAEAKTKAKRQAEAAAKAKAAAPPNEELDGDEWDEDEDEDEWWEDWEEFKGMDPREGHNSGFAGGPVGS